jgi:hypothetical protein
MVVITMIFASLVGVVIGFVLKGYQARQTTSALRDHLRCVLRSKEWMEQRGQNLQRQLVAERSRGSARRKALKAQIHRQNYRSQKHHQNY